MIQVAKESKGRDTIDKVACNFKCMGPCNYRDTQPSDSSKLSIHTYVLYLMRSTQYSRQGSNVFGSVPSVMASRSMNSTNGG